MRVGGLLQRAESRLDRRRRADPRYAWPYPKAARLALVGHLGRVVGGEAVVPGLGAAVNLRTQLLRIIARAGVEPWPRLFQNLRASCATDWTERHPAHAVAKWLGHSPMIVAEHYLQVRDHHFDDAAGLGSGSTSEATQNPTQHPPARGRTRGKPLPAGPRP